MKSRPSDARGVKQRRSAQWSSAVATALLCTVASASRGHAKFDKLLDNTPQPNHPQHTTSSRLISCLFAVCLAFLLPPSAAADHPIQRAIESLVADMEAAAIAADRDGYLRHVVTHDRRFRIEQEHWADDLLEHKPLELAWTAHDITPIGDTRAEATLRLTYRMVSGHAAVPGGKTAQWRAAFEYLDPDGDGPEPSRWLYAGDLWITLPADGFVVKHLPGDEDLAHLIREIFPIAKSHVDRGFEIVNDDPQEIKLYRDMEHLKASVYLGMPDEWLGGWNEPGESIKFMTTYANTRAKWTRAFAHEYGHVATWELGPLAHKMPWWACEGVAEVAAEAFFDEAERQALEGAVRRLAARGQLADWNDISDYRTTRANLKWQAYVQGWHFVGFVSDRFGRAGRNAWLRRMAQGDTVEQATLTALDMTFTDLDAQWRASLGVTQAEQRP